MGKRGRCKDRKVHKGHFWQRNIAGWHTRGGLDRFIDTWCPGVADKEQT